MAVRRQDLANESTEVRCVRRIGAQKIVHARKRRQAFAEGLVEDVDRRAVARGL